MYQKVDLAGGGSANTKATQSSLLHVIWWHVHLVSSLQLRLPLGDTHPTLLVHAGEVSQCHSLLQSVYSVTVLQCGSLQCDSVTV